VYLRRFMMCRRIFYLVFVFVLSLVSTSFTDVVFGDQTVPFSLQAVGDITIDNGPRWGQDGNSNGSGLEARDIPDRRHVFLLSYDISSLKGRGPVSNVSLSNFSHDQHGEVNVYGIIEDLDLLDVESLTWNTAPGVKNDPAPELNSSVTAALDMNDLTDVLLTFSGPGETGVRFSTDTSDALADFINSDTDGIITLLVVPAAEGNQLIIRSREHSAGGTFLEGQAAPIAKIIWVSDNKGYGTEPNLAADHGFVDLLRSNGYDVVYKNEFEYIDGTQYWRTLDDDKIAELEAADLVIMSRNGDSGSYSTAADNEPNQWNAVTTPLISLSAYMSRVGKWGWLNGTSTFRAKEAMMKVVDPNHPVFAGVAIDPNGLVEATSAQYNMDWVTGVTDAGNGKILAIRPDDGLLSIVTWEAGQKYFDGSLYTAGGPRMLFIAGTGSGNNDPNYSPDGAYNLTSEGEKMFLNAMKYMLPAAPATPTHLYTFEDGTAKDEIDSADGTLVGGAEIIDGAMVTTAQDQWMEMPGDVIAMNTYDAVTIEAWYIPTAGANTSWSMLAYFGDSVDGLGSNGFFITSARGDDKSRAAISIGDIATPWASESGADGPEIDDGLLHQMASTIDGTDITLYIDGELIASTPLSAANQISGISQNYAYLAKGGYTGDPEWIGAIEQFAIYDVALSEAQIAANYAAGPATSPAPQIEVAGELLVDISAADPSAGTATWVNNGTLGDFNFVTAETMPAGSSSMTPGTLGVDLTIEEFEGVPVVDVNSTSSHLVAYIGPTSVPGIEGDGDRSIEAWVADDVLPDSQAIIAWGYRADAKSCCFSYGTRNTFGALIHYSDPVDVPWGNNFNAPKVDGVRPPGDEVPTPGTLHHLVYTYEGVTVKLYRDGQLVVTRTLGRTLDTGAALPVNLFVQNNTDTGALSNNSLPVGLLVNSIRVHDGVLTDAQVLNNYEAGPAK
jgi:hypothetical protein